MANIFVRFDKERVVEVVSLSLKEFERTFHPDHVKLFEVCPASKNPKIGQVLKGNNFVDYEDSEELKQLKKKNQAQININKKQNEVIWELLKFATSQDNCPQSLKDLETDIKNNRDNL